MKGIARLSIFGALMPLPCFGLNITLDFTYDDFFTNPSNPYAAVGQAALQAAADEISSLVVTSLSPITSDLITGTSGGGFAQIRTTYRFVDPRDGVSEISRSAVGIGADEIVIYVGARSMGGFTFAEASPGLPSINLGVNSDAAWPSALANAETIQNQMYGRGMTPVTVLTGSVNFASQTSSYDMSFGPTMGSIWFNDSPSDLSSARESWETNNDYWHFDHTTSVGLGKIDLYSVAMHEMLHVLGYGTGENWLRFVDGTDWTGPAAEALLGSGVGAIEEDGFHILSGLQSPGYADGILRQTVMNGSPQPGERDQLTLLDLAFLQDTGFEIAPIPEPSSLLLLSVFGLAGIARRRC